MLILKSVKKLKSDNFLPSYDPSKEICFFLFESFTGFEKTVTLLLVKIILNFKNGKKVMSKLFLKPLINFFVQ